MLTVVESVGENTVAVVIDLYMVGSDHATWPSIGASRAKRPVRDGLSPPVNSITYKVKVYKAVDDYQQAMKLQRILEDVSD
ncbi:hypothetical protein FGIG_06148 [Fasciola gigantica]|uniref:Uncharacterized protein n=1 Tax=Fasciola gigantica TaxID=46835 RepID=A0A504YHV8_FASGI|nr:hypothetical protein FGIG_06148 [Fasciola gigantica]